MLHDHVSGSARMRSRRIAVGLIAIGLLAAACTGAAESGVNVRTLSTDLIYGIPPTPEPASPANTNPIPAAPKPVVSRGDTDDLTPKGPGGVTPPQSGCPKAPPTAFPKPAKSAVEGRPKAGDYRWKVSGWQETGTFGRINLPTFTQRSIGAVVSTEAGFRFTTVERELTFGSSAMVSMTYEVRNAIEEDGIYLLGIVRESDSGRTQFAPAPAILILPLPARVGGSNVPDNAATPEEWESVGVDPTTFEVLRHFGRIPRRHRVDACGTVVDSFFVDGHQEFVSAQGDVTRRNYDYGVATQFGGLIVYEHVATPCASEGDDGKCTPEPTFLMDTNIGQVEPR